MKVQGPNRPSHVDPVRGKSTSSVSEPEKATAHRAETVSVSSSAKALGEARAPEVPDAARIARLKDAIVGGSFKIDASRIADAMLREEV